MATNKATAKKAAPKAPREPLQVRNGIKRPREGGQCAKVWAICDKLAEKAGGCAVRADVLAEAAKKDLNPAMTASNYQVWRVFHGFAGAKTPKPPKAAKAAKAVKKAASKKAAPAKKATSKRAPKAPPAPPAAEANASV